GNLPSEMDAVWRELERYPDSKLELCGHQADVRQAYARCDIVICPSREESFCRVVAEAMLNGIPVVASDIAAIRELVGDDEAGILVPAGDAERAAAAVTCLARDPDLRRRLGDEGRRRATAFDPERVADLLVSLYRRTARAR